MARPLQRHRLLHHLVGLRLLVGLHQRVDVGPQHERLTPIGHRQVGIETRRLAKRPACLGMIERVGEIEPLIHERLGLTVARGYPEHMRAQVLQARRQRTARRLLRAPGFRVMHVAPRRGLALPGRETDVREQRDRHHHGQYQTCLQHASAP